MRNLLVIHGRIIGWLQEFLLQIHISFQDIYHDLAKHGFCIHDIKLQRQLTAARKQRINDLCLTSKFKCRIKVTSQY